jgi:hypothetical protein
MSRKSERTKAKLNSGVLEGSSDDDEARSNPIQEERDPLFSLRKLWYFTKLIRLGCIQAQDGSCRLRILTQETVSHILKFIFCCLNSLSFVLP